MPPKKIDNEDPIPVMPAEIGRMEIEHDLGSLLVMISRVHEWHIKNDLSGQMTIKIGKAL